MLGFYDESFKKYEPDDTLPAMIVVTCWVALWHVATLFLQVTDPKLRLMPFFLELLVLLALVAIAKQRGGIKNLWQRYLQTNIIGYEIIERPSDNSYRDIIRSIKRRDNKDVGGERNLFSVHLKLGGWGGKRAWIAFNGKEHSGIKLELVQMMQYATVVRAKSGNGDVLSLSTWHLLELLACSGGFMPPVASDCLHRKVTRLTWIIQETINKIRESSRFFKSREGQQIREWLEKELKK
jgi:hypothetical protein